MSFALNANFGDTISKGIQDVAALLPLLGTDQCERHVGAALESGYIYAAATPLSIFGSLGIVKAAFATLLASNTSVFHGGKWFHNAGFGMLGSGSAIPLVTIVNGTKHYGAELKLQNLLREQHLDDPELISDVEYFGWKTKSLINRYSPDLPSDRKFSFSWTFALVLASAIFSTISFTPYLYLAHNQWDKPMSWLFPALRSIGSMLCVVSVQRALQLRIHRIVKSSLLLMKSQKYYPRSPEEDSSDMQTLMEARLQILHAKLKKDSWDKEQGGFDSTKRVHLEEVKKVLCLNIRLLVHQVSLLAGMVMIVIGYIGCFNLVNGSNAKNGPYIWLGMEAFLSVLRMALWGWNPRWAQGDTGLEMKLKLWSKGASLHHPTHPTTSRTSIFPLITTSRSLSQLTSSASLRPGVQREAPKPTESFIAVSAEDFLAAATPYVGPLRRLRLNGISLFHAIVPEINGIPTGVLVKRKLLCLTARRDDSDWASVSIFIREHGSDEPYKVYSSRCWGLRGTQSRSLQVTLEDVLSNESGTNAFIDNATFRLMVQYSLILFRRIFIQEPVSSIRPLWTLVLPCSPMRKLESESRDVPLTHLDDEYMQLREMDDQKVVPNVFITDPARDEQPQLAEYIILFHSAILEIRLCIEDHWFVESKKQCANISRPLAWEWIRRMEGRITSEKKRSMKRLRDSLSDSESIDVEETWDSLFRELHSLRQLPIDNPHIKGWREKLRALYGGDIPPVLELFELRPFKALPHLRRNFLPLLTDENPTSDNDSIKSYMKSDIRSALRSLCVTEPFTPPGRNNPQSSGFMELSLPHIPRGCGHSQDTLIESRGAPIDANNSS
ncbi:hypothetical protein V5O48_015764 [Marasmius crinis-equi]|uniref:Uncharacterized protein n=1 Tax=Marasmius crinis-equi TaxID=585013 RepID=A0ABR3ETM3_9AGAR